MFDNNYDKDGVSIWGHMMDGAATGAGAGALFGGVGAIPGAVLGGLVGLGNGIYDNYQDNQNMEKFKQNVDSGKDSCSADAIERAAMAKLDNSGAGSGGVNAAVDGAVADVYRQQQMLTNQNQKDASWFDNLF